MFALSGFFKAATEGVEKSLVADLAPLGLVGTAFGWLYENYGTQYAFLYSASCASVALGIFLISVFPFRPNVINGVEAQKGLNSIT